VFDNLVRLFGNPIVLVSVGIPTAIAVYQFVDSRRKAPLEDRKLHADIKRSESEAKAAVALEAANLVQVVNLIMGLLTDMREEIRADLANVTNHQNEQIRAWLDNVEARIERVERSLDVKERPNAG
jgi:hypothetical protein